jgi:hypothetical protein
VLLGVDSGDAEVATVVAAVAGAAAAMIALARPPVPLLAITVVDQDATTNGARSVPIKANDHDDGAAYSLAGYEAAASRARIALTLVSHGERQ